MSFTDRTHTCGSLRESDVGQTVKLCGWVQYNRHSAKFIVIRDWSGITQVIVPQEKVILNLLSSLISNINFEKWALDF